MFVQPPADKLSRVPGIYTSELADPEDTVIHGHFFIGSCHWYVAEFDGDDSFFGFVNLGDPDMAEWGYFSLSELRAIRLTSNLRCQKTGQLLARVPVAVEWDQHWRPRPFRETDAFVRS